MGVDSSTQSTKIEVRDVETGELVASATAPHPPTSPPRSEQQPSAWWGALAAAIAQSGCDEVDAISVAAQQHGMVALDAAGDVLRPAKLWNDTESAADATALVTALGAEEWAREVGSVPVASFTVSKLAWLKRNEPEAYEAAAKVMLPHDWLTMKLTGRTTTDRGDASGTGYWSPATGAWSGKALAAVDESRDLLPLLPEVVAPDEAVGEVGRDAAEMLGIPAGSLVATGTGDNMAAALGLALRPGDVVVSIGTSGTAYAYSPDPVADPSGSVAGFADATGGYLPLACTLNAAKVTDAFARILGVETDWLARMAVATPMGAGGVTLLPYLDGERTPNRPDATGVMVGISSETTPEEIARAAYEGVVMGLLDAVDALARIGVDTESGRMILIGGGARSDAYRRVLADLSGREVFLPDEREHVATGAAIQAASVLSHAPPGEIVEAWGLSGGTRVEPRPVEAVDETRIRYRELRDAAGERAT